MAGLIEEASGLLEQNLSQEVAEAEPAHRGGGMPAGNPEGINPELTYRMTCWLNFIA